MTPTAFEARCPTHGPLAGQTKCRFCSYTLIDFNRSDLLPPNALGHSSLSPPFYSPDVETK